MALFSPLPISTPNERYAALTLLRHLVAADERALARSDAEAWQFSDRKRAPDDVAVHMAIEINDTPIEVRVTNAVVRGQGPPTFTTTYESTPRSYDSPLVRCGFACTGAADLACHVVFRVLGHTVFDTHVMIEWDECQRGTAIVRRPGTYRAWHTIDMRRDPKRNIALFSSIRSHKQ